MDRLIRECRSIAELNRIIDRGLDDVTYQLAMDRLFELVLEGEINDRENNEEAGNATAAPSNDSNDLEGNGLEIYQETNETLPSTSTGARSTVDDINTMDDIESLNRIIDEDNWTTPASGIAFQRILQLGGIEDFDELIRDWTDTANKEMQGDSEDRLADLMEVIDADNMAGGDNPIELEKNVSGTI